MQNDIIETVRSLKPSQAIHLGHSMVIGNFGGTTIGFDLSTQDGMIPAPFSNLALHRTSTIPHLLPLPETTHLIAKANEVAKYLDVLVYSHLHSDHFSLDYVAEAIKANPKIRIICPPNTKSYLEHTGQGKTTNSPNFMLKPLVNWLQKRYKDGIDDLLEDIKTNNAQRKHVIDRIEEASLSSITTITRGKQSVTINAFPAIHPAFQLYVKMPFEFDPPPLVVGFKVTYEDNGQKRCAIFIGEGASDPNTLSEIFTERERLEIVFFPITEQYENKGIKLILEFGTHSSLRILAMVEKIVTEKTKIVPLHHSFWYFKLDSNYIVKGRNALRNLGYRKNDKLPFVSLTQKFMSLAKGQEYYSPYIRDILSTTRKRWWNYKKLAVIVNLLPTNGLTKNSRLGSIIDFSSSEKTRPPKAISKEALQSSLQALITEWQLQHKQIDGDSVWQDHLLNYILLTIGSVITLVSVFSDLELLFIVASFILSLLGWAVIEKSIHMMSIGRFYSQELAPHANALIREMEDLDVHDPIANKLRILLWEDFFRGRNIHILMQGLAGAGRFMMATVPGFASAMTFLYLKQSTGTNWSILELILFSIASGMSLLPLATLFINAKYAYSGEK